ncbi:MAG: hypothetical protein JWM21_1539 [Acidobacteria bacterium]|nr:hypothetical protein [Acidobacteriota bacterium]
MHLSQKPESAVEGSREGDPVPASTLNEMFSRLPKLKTSTGRSVFDSFVFRKAFRPLSGDKVPS